MITITIIVIVSGETDICGKQIFNTHQGEAQSIWVCHEYVFWENLHISTLHQYESNLFGAIMWFQNTHQEVPLYTAEL